MTQPHLLAIAGTSALVIAVSIVQAQAPFAGRGRRQPAGPEPANVAYDGRFTFVRLRYTPEAAGYYFRREPPWAHDYPTAERHLARILRELTYLSPYMDGGNILTLDDPELFKFPIAYMSEPGFWTLTDKEAAGLRAYLLKGGFLIFDDFRGPDWDNFASAMHRVMPESRLLPLDAAQPIFHSFFEIPSPASFVPPYGGLPAEFYGVFEGNDPEKRLMIIADYNNDIGEYWEFSDTGYAPIDLTNEAYKFGVNYIIYGMTH